MLRPTSRRGRSRPSAPGAPTRAPGTSVGGFVAVEERETDREVPGRTRRARGRRRLDRSHSAGPPVGARPRGDAADADDVDGHQRLTLSSFDYEVSAQVSVDVDIDEPGRILVSGKLLAEMRSLPPQTVEVSTEAKVVVLRQREVLILTLLWRTTRPSRHAGADRIRAQRRSAAAVSQAVAAGRDDTLPMLTGVRIEIEGSTVTPLTDRYRLSRELTWTRGPSVSAVALVPAPSPTPPSRSPAAPRSPSPCPPRRTAAKA